MRDDFEITAPQVDLAQEAALAAGRDRCAHDGGGFGGCVIALVEASGRRPGAVGAAVERAFEQAGYGPPVPFVVTAAAGAHRALAADPREPRVLLRRQRSAAGPRRPARRR